jgi:hypothetical protein
MNRKPSKNRNGRGPNSAEKAFQGWLKNQPCVWCGNEGPSIVDHCKGSTFGHNKVHIGHWFCIPQCVECDTKKTVHGRRQGDEAGAWCGLMAQYKGVNAEDCVWMSIISWGKQWQPKKI